MYTHPTSQQQMRVEERNIALIQQSRKVNEEHCAAGHEHAVPDVVLQGIRRNTAVGVRKIGSISLRKKSKSLRCSNQQVLRKDPAPAL